MAILTGAAIKTAIEKGEIKIDNLKKDSIGTESIDLHLGSEIKKMLPNKAYWIDHEYGGDWIEVFDPKEDYQYELIKFDSNNSVLLMPNQLYLGHTIEVVGSEFYHPQLHDKSSCMRAGISTHGNSGFGDLGFIGAWTLEIQVVKPTILYLGMAICQISFETVIGEKSLYSERKSSKYMNQKGATESKIIKNFI
jgi:dCTP deaminase